MHKLAVLVATFAALIIAPTTADAVITEVLDGDLTCGVVQDNASVDSAIGQRWCGSKPGSITNSVVPALPSSRSTHKTFDGVPLDVNVAIPPDPNPAADTDWPVVGMYHSYAGSKANFEDMQRWLDKGYAVFSITNRGSGESCQSSGSKAADPTGCAKGYLHLMDPRFEIRDAQNFLGELVDENVINPTRIAATGNSYGGGESIWFGVLRNRMMNPDGSLVPWQSPLGVAMSTAVTRPNIAWTDLIQAIAPNGDTLDYLRDGSYSGKVGVMKESLVQSLYVQTRNAPIGTDPGADLMGWVARLNEGEPYPDMASDAMATEMTRFHSPYYGDHSQAPAPMLMSAGFTDDLFPVDEVIRYYNRTRAQFPNTPLSIFAGSFGHPRGQGQTNVRNALRNLEEQWFDYYLKDIGAQPSMDVTAYTQTCQSSTGGGPYNATDWASLSPGELVLKSSGGARTIAPTGGDLAVSALFNPLSSGTTACTAASDTVETGSATYDMAAAPAGGYTVLGSVTVIARITVENGPNSQIAARLFDLDGAGNRTLISRGAWRPDSSGWQVFQLFPGAWKVEAGHSLRLELLPKDAAEAAGGLRTNFLRPSNSQMPVTVDKLELRVPVVEAPGALNGLVKAPEKKVLPDRTGAALAPGYQAIGSETLIEYSKRVDPCPTGTTGTPPNCQPHGDPQGTPFVTGKIIVKGKVLKTRIRCKSGNGMSGFEGCFKINLAFKGAPKKGNKGKRLTIAKRRGLIARPGQTKKVTLKLTGKARKFFRDRSVRNRGMERIKRGPKSLLAKVLINGKKSGFKTVRRVGTVK